MRVKLIDAIAILLLCLSSPAQADSSTGPVAYTSVTFTGILTYGQGVNGPNVKGSITFVDDVYYSQHATDGISYNIGYINKTKPDQSPVFAGLNDFGPLSIGSALSNSIEYKVQRNAPADHQNMVLIQAASNLGEGLINLWIEDTSGASSHIFNTPAGDLSLNQSINWYAPGAHLAGNYQYLVSGQTYETGAFTITQFSIRSGVGIIPEPSTCALLIIGLAIIFVSTGQRRFRA